MTDRDKLGPPPVEPMSNAAWTRVERGLWEKVDELEASPVVAPRRARWPWLVAPMVAAAAAFAIVIATRETPQDAPPVVGEDTHEVSRVVAGDTPSAVSFGDAHLTLEARAAIVMQREAASPSVLIERGAVDFTVAPRTGAPFVVRAGDVTVRVVGTQFRVGRYEEHVTVAVERGIVDVLYRGDVHRLTAGRNWSSLEKTALAPVAPVAQPDEPPAPQAGEEQPAPAPKQHAAAPVKTEPPTQPAPPATQAQPTGSDPDQAKFNQYAALERRDPNKAIDGYLELSRGNTKWSANALYAAARLAAERNDKRARTFLRVYLQRFPNGANAAVARDLLSRLDGAQQ